MTAKIYHIDEELLRRALEAAQDKCSHYWCWMRDKYEEADRLRCDLAELLGEPREPRPWPNP